MSKQQAGIDVSFKVADVDMSSYQYRFVKMSGSDSVALVSAAANTPVGILQNKPTTEGAEAIVRILGHSKVVGNASLTVGNLVGPTSAGRAQAVTPTATATATIAGVITVAPSAQGEVGEMLIIPCVSHI